MTEIVHLRRGTGSWPRELDGIEDPPFQLWLRGREELLRPRPRVAIVGSRAPTGYGEDQARRFGAALAGAGVCVVSGLARGVDAAAHAGALAAGGDTIAVLGCGVDDPWPRTPLADAVANQGLLASEYAPGVRPRRHHFPLRNRIISGLADAVLVVEAAHASGSLITARWAADQGRAVFALPGRVDHPMARGTLRLVREGATPVGSPVQLLEDLYGLTPSGETASGPAPPDSELLRALRGETLDAEDLARRLERPLAPVLAELVGLELEGVVRRGPGGLYRLARGDRAV